MEDIAERKSCNILLWSSSEEYPSRLESNATYLSVLSLLFHCYLAAAWCVRDWPDSVTYAFFFCRCCGLSGHSLATIRYQVFQSGCLIIHRVRRNAIHDVAAFFGCRELRREGLHWWAGVGLVRAGVSARSVCVIWVSARCLCVRYVSARSGCVICVLERCVCVICESALSVCHFCVSALSVCVFWVSERCLCVCCVSARSVCVICVSAHCLCVICVSARRLCVICVSARRFCVSSGCTDREKIVLNYA